MKLHWKEDMSFECPYCGFEYNTTAYLNIEDSTCPRCGKEFYVELHVANFTQECIKQETDDE